MKVVNWLVYACLKAFLLMGRYTPMAPTFWCCQKLAALLYPLMKGRRALMLYNLELALGDSTTPEQREEIARKSFENLFVTFGELLHMDQIYAHWQDNFEFVGAEIVDRFIEQGKGFFVFGGHFGGWTSMAAVHFRFPGLPGLNMVAKPLRNPKMQELLDFLGMKLGGKIVSTRGAGKQIEEAAARGELIGLYMDQESRRDQGVFVKFFGRDASSHVVPGYLAWKNGIPLIPYWIPRNRPGKFTIIFRDPLKYELTDDKDENNRRVTQLIAAEVEATIRQYPDQWLWAHNRWRRRPDGTKVELFEKKQWPWSRSKSRRAGEYLSSKDLARKKEPGDQPPDVKE